MCELFAMSSASQAIVNYSLERFSRHGGLTAGNKDGWGICFHEGTEARIIKEPHPASTSPWVRFIAEQKIGSQCVIAHVRLASHGEPKLENTHPYERELAGRRHVLAHNGTLHGFEAAIPLHTDRYRAMGDTDSEHMFCVLLERIHDLWTSDDSPPTWQARLDTVAAFAAQVRSLGQANFLYTDGDVLFVHAHKRRYEIDGELTEPRAPGLHVRYIEKLSPTDGFHVDGLDVECEDQDIMLFASVPLGADDWLPLDEGTVLAIKDGRELGRVSA